MKKSRKGRWREMLSSGKKSAIRKSLRCSSKRKLDPKHVTPSKSGRKVSKKGLSSSKKKKSAKKSLRLKGRESISSKSRKLAKEMILKSFRKKT
jgi:hypothetical protein